MEDKLGKSSPQTSKKLELSSLKVSLNDVQEGIKAMHQKRLSRLSAVVAEKTGLLEGRIDSKDRDSDNIQTTQRMSSENSIVKSVSFESILEEKSAGNSAYQDSDTNVEVSFKSKGEAFKLQPRRKFLNKFNCVVNKEQFSSPDEEQSEFSKCGRTSKDNGGDIKQSNGLDENNGNISVQKLLQRKPIHFPNDFTIDSLSKFGRNSSNPQVNSVKPLVSINMKQNDSHLGSVKSSDMIRKQQLSKDTLTRDLPAEAPSSSFYREPDKFGLNKTDEFKMKYSGRMDIKSAGEHRKKTINLPKEEKILKKFQMNYSTLTNLVKNDSDKDCSIDSDEMEHLQNTLKDARALLEDYEVKLKTLNEKLQIRKFNDFREGIDDIRRQIVSFRGLRQDGLYGELVRKLTSFEKEIWRFQQTTMEKQEILKYLKSCSTLLENRVKINEQLLYELLKELVNIISTRRIKETFL